MEYTTLIELTKSYIRHSGKPVNDLIFVEKLRLYAPPALKTIDDVYQHLQYLGDANQFIFKLQYIKRNELIQQIQGVSFPLIVFENKASVSPMLILPKSQGDSSTNQHIQFFDSNTSEPKLFSTDEWVQQVCDGHQARSLNLSDNTAEKESDECIVISGFPLPSIVSDNGKHLTPLQRVFALMRSERKDIGLIYFYAVMMGIVSLSLPLGIQAIIGLISGGLFLNSAIVLMFFVVAATLVSGWLQILQLSVVEILQQRLFAKAAFEFTYRIPRLKTESLGNQYAPELMNRFFDIMTIQKSLPKILIDVSTSGVQILFGLILLAFYHPLFVFFGILLTVIIAFIFYATGKAAVETDINTSKYKYKVAYWIEEIARALPTFKLAGDTPLPMAKLDLLLSNYLQYRKKHFAILVKQFRAIIAFKVFITAGLLVLGSYLVVERQISLGQFVAAEVIILLVISSVEKLIGTLESVYDLITAADKVGHITDLTLEETGGIQIPDTSQPFELQLNQVSYQYVGKDEKALSEISLHIKQGESICVSGYNGSGKTTLTKVISGLLTDYKGQALVNGVPLRELNLNYYRRLIANNLSDQEVFEGTIEENITLGKQYTLAHILESIAKAGLTGYVNKQPKGILTNLQAGGSNLSKSIRQKILIARSFIQSPKLLLVDEFFYNAEKHEKQEMLKQLFSDQNGWGIVIISNDPEIMQLCNLVVVMSEGKILAQGTYTHLSENRLIDSLI